MDNEKQRVPEHHFKQDLMLTAAVAVLLLIFFLDKRFNNSRIFDALLNRQSRVGESAKSNTPQN